VRPAEPLSHPLPRTLARLLAADAEEEREASWEAFVGEFSRLIHLAARRSARGYDDVMDRYAFILESVRRDDCKRLRGFVEGGRSSFGTWLVVVSSRLCVDYHRTKYGRVPSGQEDKPAAQERRRLVDLVGEAIDLSDLPDASEANPEERTLQCEAGEALASSLQALSAEDRLLVRLRLEDDLPMREVARTLGLSSEFAGYRRLKAVLTGLRRELGSRGFGGPSP
jgi:RNA polymerase sigma factor (sigma-70 family)